MSASITYEEAVKLFVSNHRMASDNPDSFPVVLDLSLEPAIYEGKEGIRYLVDSGNHGVQEVGWIYEADHPGKVPKKRWPFQATQDDKQLIDAINAARPLDRKSVPDGIRYALEYTVGNDPEVIAMAETDFRVDGTLYNTGNEREIEYMVTSERAGGAFQNLLCRKPRKSGPGFYFADVGWNGIAGQMRSGKWFCGGRTAAAVDYVANWRKRQ